MTISVAITIAVSLSPLSSHASSLGCPQTYQPVCGVSQRFAQGSQTREILWTYANSCLAESVGITDWTAGTCQSSSRLIESSAISSATEKPTTSNEGSAPISFDNLGSLIQTQDPTLIAMWTSIVKKIDTVEGIEAKKLYLTKLVEGLIGQRDSLEKNSESYIQIGTILTTIHTVLSGTPQTSSLKHEPTQPIATPPTNQTIAPTPTIPNPQTNPTSTASFPKPSYDYHTNLGSTMIESNYQWIWTQEGSIIRGKRIDQEMVIHLGSENNTATQPKPQPVPYTGPVLSTADSFDAVIYTTIRDQLCPSDGKNKRTIAYQKVLSKTDDQTAITTDTILVMCRSWSKQGETYEPLSIKVKPVTLVSTNRQGKVDVITLTIPAADQTYTSTIMTAFDPSTHNLLLGKEPEKYQAIITTLTETNAELVSQ